MRWSTKRDEADQREIYNVGGENEESQESNNETHSTRGVSRKKKRKP